MPRQTVQDEFEDILNRLERFGNRIRSATGTNSEAVMHRRDVNLLLGVLGPVLKTTFGAVVCLGPNDLKEGEI